MPVPHDVSSKPPPPSSFGETITSYQYHQQNPHDVHAFVSDERMKNHIKRVLDFEEKNETLDKYIKNSFNLYNNDPVYTFILPGEHNHTLVYRRSNFTEAIFPDIVPLKQMRKLSYASLQLAQQRRFFEKKSEKYDIPKLKYDQFRIGIYDLDEAASMRIVEENVRTERNFLAFMENLNQNHDNEVDTGSKVIQSPNSLQLDDRLTSVSAKDDDGLNEYEIILKNIQAKAEEKHELLLTGETRAEIKEYNWRRAHNISWHEIGLDGWRGNLDSKYVPPTGNG